MFYHFNIKCYDLQLIIVNDQINPITIVLIVGFFSFCSFRDLGYNRLYDL